MRPIKRINWQIMLGILLIILSAITYFFHWVIFRDPHHIFIFLIGDISFVFIEVLLVTLILHEILEIREKRAKKEKLNIILSLFFSEVGTKLLAITSDADPNLDNIRKHLLVKDEWTDRKFSEISRRLKGYDFDIDMNKIDLLQIEGLLSEKRAFTVNLLENPALLEHETFTDLLQAVFHMTEELSYRKDLTCLDKRDLKHIRGDIKRVYGQLISEWLDYMKHLKVNYPYLFSLAMRTNPFDMNASAEVR